jgi:altronate hydrolase
MKTNCLLIHKDDNVVVALKPLAKGETITVGGETILVKADIPAGHKIACRPIGKGENIIKYGHPIGHATAEIPAGEWVHSHNLETNLSGTLDYAYRPERPQLPRPEAGGVLLAGEASFNGYVRENGDVGIRNEIWVLNTVGCINKTAETIARIADARFSDKGRPEPRGIDGVYHFPHPFGCSQLGDDLLNTQKILAGLVHHPNAGGVLVLGLGCENNNINEFKKVLGDFDERRIKFLEMQEVEDETGEALRFLEELANYAATFKREPVPAAKLKVGLKCGGSDGFSGISANPLVGVFTDLLLAHGGTAVLTEVPEIFGAETILMARAEREEVFAKIVKLVNGFKDYYLRHGQPVYENPSPGNKAGGITTQEEKSFGCIEKAGSAPVVEVLAYGERLQKTGLHLLEGPGNDLVAVTALAAAGVQLVLFTTGRGTPYGGPVPTVKIANTTELYQKKKHWIDFDAGDILTGITGLEELAGQLFVYILDVASGRAYTRNEISGAREIAILKDGVIL